MMVIGLGKIYTCIVLTLAMSMHMLKTSLDNNCSQLTAMLVVSLSDSL